MNLIFRAVKKVLLSLSPQKSLIDGIFRWDFKIGESRESLMQLCFSSLAAWPLLLLMAAVEFDPTRELWSLPRILGEESSVVYFLLDGHGLPMLSFFVVLFVLEWLFRREYLLIFILTLLSARGELHINLAFAGLCGILLSRTSYMWWLAIDSEGETRHVWGRLHQIQLLSWGAAAGFGSYALDFLQTERLFAAEGLLTRSHFLIMVVVCFYFLNQVVMSLWGHFYIRRQVEPSKLPVSYSSAMWILRLPLSGTLTHLLKKEINAKLSRHQDHLKSLAELKKANPQVSALPIEAAIGKELEYLKEANLRLSQA